MFFRYAPPATLLWIENTSPIVIAADKHFLGKILNIKVDKKRLITKAFFVAKFLALFCKC